MVSLRGPEMEFSPQLRPIRTVLKWQLIATAALTMVAMLLWGKEGAVSAALGGAINVAAGWVYGWRVSQGEARTAGEALRTLFRAWGMKVLTIVALLIAVLANYKDIVHAAFLASFVVTVAVFAAAIAVRDGR
ncbi:MAG TPA: ATP synthase subunit I [Burkholderiales bacterium]|nr:ATP synthase subunit I [Burkholderiales bacterium]